LKNNHEAQFQTNLTLEDGFKKHSIRKRIKKTRVNHVNPLNSLHESWEWDNIIESKLTKKKKHEDQVPTNPILEDGTIKKIILKKIESNRVNPKNLQHGQ